MKTSAKIAGAIKTVSTVTILALMMLACEKKTAVEKIDILTLPSATRKDLKTILSDSGKIQIIMTAPIVESFMNTETPYSEFKSGVDVLFYDGQKEPVASVKAKYAKYTDSKYLWELKDSVVAVNESGDMLETELLFLDQKKNLIYTDRFVKITNQDQIVQGFGFESDTRLTKRKIKNVSATIYVKDEQ